MSSSLQVARIPRCDPARFARVEAGLLARGWPAPLLVVAGLGEPVLLLGRHQRARSAVRVDAARARGLLVTRRAGGGRAVLAGHGTAGVFLWSPPGDPLLATVHGPDRMLQRGVRGLLAGLRAAGARTPSWAGRDEVSVDGRTLALASQEGTADGGTAIEALVAVDRTLEVPSALVAYPQGRAGGPEPVTLAQVRGEPVGFDQLAAALEQGFAAAYDRDPEPARGLLPEEPLPPAEEDEEGLGASGPVEVPIGFAEALASTAGGLVDVARLRGDFMAPAFAVAELERALRGAPLDPVEIGGRVDAAFACPGAFLNGVPDTRVLADAVLAAAQAS